MAKTPTTGETGTDNTGGTTPPAETAADAKAPKVEKRYRVVPSGAGGFLRDELVTEQQIKEKGASLADWLAIGSVVPEGDADPERKVTIPRPPAPLKKK